MTNQNAKINLCSGILHFRSICLEFRNQYLEFNRVAMTNWERLRMTTGLLAMTDGVSTLGGCFIPGAEASGADVDFSFSSF